jgi:hypothetical protein
VSEENQTVDAVVHTPLSDVFAARDRGEELPRPEPTVTAAPIAEPVAQPETPAEEPDSTDKPEPTRGPDGKFVKGDPAVALRQAREEAKTLKAQLEALQKAPAPTPASATPEAKPEPPKRPDMPDPLLQPDEYRAWDQQVRREAQLDVFEELAHDRHGKDKVDAAVERLKATIQQQGNSLEYQRIMQQRNPYSALMKWDAEQAAMSEIGPDPVAYREKLRAEILAELQAETQTPPAAQPAAKLPASMPSNFANLRNAAPSGQQWAGPTPLKSVLSLG